MSCDRLYQPPIQLGAIKFEKTLYILHKILSNFANNNTREENQFYNDTLSDKVREPMKINEKSIAR